MKKVVSLLLALVLVWACMSAVAEDEKVTISLLTTRHTTATNDIEDVWFFKYAAEKFNVEFELEQTLEASQRTSLMFASDSLPDIVWAVALSANDTVTYGVNEGLLLKWDELIDEETMPNLYAAMQQYPEAFIGSTAPDGHIYALPYIKGYSYYSDAGAMSNSIRMFINTEWLEAVNMDMPTSLDEFLDVLRAFKEQDPAGVGSENVIPLLSSANRDRDFIWHALGFAGGATQVWGTGFSIKADGEVYLPCYTEEAKEFLEFYHTCYEEGLISQDYFTMDTSTVRATIASGVCGAFGDWGLMGTGDNWAEWTAMPLLTSDYCDYPVCAMNWAYTYGMLYASAKSENIEKICEIVDYMYSDEGMYMYKIGPQDGSEYVYEGYDGWYLDENGNKTNAAVEAGLYTSYGV